LEEDAEPNEDLTFTLAFMATLVLALILAFLFPFGKMCSNHLHKTNSHDAAK